MRPQYLITILCLLAAGSGCVSSMQVETDYNPSTDFDVYQTYRWTASSDMENPFAATDSLLIRHFKYTVDQELAKRGYFQTRGEADFMVALYEPQFGDGRQTPWDPGDLMIKPGPHDKMILEVIDISRQVCVWRGVTDQAFDDVDPDILWEKVNEAVTRMFDLFPKLPETDRLKNVQGEQP